MMRLATNNQDVIRRTDTQIRAARRSLSYFEATLRDLQTRRTQGQADGSRQYGPQGGPSSPTSNRQQQPWLAGPGNMQAAPMPGNGNWEGMGSETTSPIQDLTPKAKNYTNLGSFLKHRKAECVSNSYRRSSESRYPSHKCQNISNASST